ncbi:sucrose-phosphate synthase [Haloferula helveola]|uniref:sucrose-phosphate synthase n=1 Tax=Haloferula helveola TaxID=490095 RepID=A0ABM7REN9_9BACT|nr:sucrose-phosphate synthase [Haloferula helveola]
MNRKLDILHFSLHGLIRGQNLELGRDPDTGGQCLYVLELVKALAKHEQVSRVTLVTRRVFDPRVSDDYAEAVEDLGDGADIRRIEAGTRRYLRKEVLWRHLDAFIDGTLAWLRRERRVPDLIHAHYADAGYVGRQVAAVLGVPFAFTGHSLGRVKRQRLIDGGVDEETIERKYNLAVRIEAEELSLEAASMVCTSTRQEVEEQYSMYDRYAEESMRVIPPGVDLTRFDGEGNTEAYESVDAKMKRFLNDPSKPAVFTIARADERKNLTGLVRAFGNNAWLRENANLVLVGGNRETLKKLPSGARKVWTELLRLIDDLDLYGVCAVPKQHQSQEVPEFYRWAAARKGVFVNPAFTEPFGLTLLEAAAANLPLVATNDGGPRDILANCKNGTLVDAMDDKAIGDAIEEIVAEPDHQQKLAKNGAENVRRFYSWDAHVDSYLSELSKVLPAEPRSREPGSRQYLTRSEHWIVMDLPPHLEEEPPELVERWRQLFREGEVGMIFATGLSYSEARDVIERLEMPRPSILITGLGAEIHYGWKTPIKDEIWNRQARLRWNRDGVVDAFKDFPGLSMQPEERQHELKVSLLLDEGVKCTRESLQRHLREAGLSAKVMITSGCFVDVLPIRSGKDVAVRYIEMKWGIDPARVYCYGTYGNDSAVIRGRLLSAVAADSDPVLRRLRERPRLYHCSQPGLAGFFEGLDHYRFFEDQPPPLPAEEYYSEDEEVPAIEIEP